MLAFFCLLAFVLFSQNNEWWFYYTSPKLTTISTATFANCWTSGFLSYNQPFGDTVPSHWLRYKLTLVWSSKVHWGQQITRSITSDVSRNKQLDYDKRSFQLLKRVALFDQNNIYFYSSRENSSVVFMVIFNIVRRFLKRSVW